MKQEILEIILFNYAKRKICRNWVIHTVKMQLELIKYATNFKIIFYIVNLPTVESQICKTVDIRAIKKN